MKKYLLIFLITIFTLSLSALSFAESKHSGMSGMDGSTAGSEHQGMTKDEHKSDSSHMSHPKAKEASQDGIKAKFHLMTMEEHMKEMGSMAKEHKMDMKHSSKDKSSVHSHKMSDGKVINHSKSHGMLSHHIALELNDEKTGKSITDAKVDLTITSPSGKAETKKLSKMQMGNETHYYLDADLKEKGDYLFEFFVNIKDNETKLSFEEKIQ